MTTPTQVRIDSNIKEEVTVLFKKLGLDMSSAINLFLHQCLLNDGLPFNVGLPHYNKETIEAMKEAKQISKDSKVKSYSSLEELHDALDK